MTERNDPSQHRSALGARRLTLLMSVAGVGVAVLIGGAGGHRPTGLPAWTPSAHAAGAVQSPAGFADIVAKVKPAVISVRVKVDEFREDDEHERKRR